MCFGVSGCVKVILWFLLDVAEITLPGAEVDYLVFVCSASDCFIVLLQLFLSKDNLLLDETRKVLLDRLRSRSSF